MPSKIPLGESRGWIVPIGGAENKENNRHILERFVRVSGGADADIVVIPTASRMHETGARYEQLFSDLGAAKVTVMDFDTRRDCQEAGRLRVRVGVVLAQDRRLFPAERLVCVGAQPRHPLGAVAAKAEEVRCVDAQGRSLRA